MPRKKENKDGFHLKYLPTGRLNDLLDLAYSFHGFEDKTLVACKYIETFSSVVERCWNSEKSFVPISQEFTAAKTLGINKLQAKIILDDLVKHKFLERDKSTYRLGKAAWSYKAVYRRLDVVAINRRFLNKKTDLMLDGSNISSLNPELKPYGDVISKIKLDTTVYKFMRDIIGNKFNYGKLIPQVHGDSLIDIVYKVSMVDNKPCHTYIYGGNILSNISGNIYQGSFVPNISGYQDSFVPNLSGYQGSFVPNISDQVPFTIVGKIPAEFISVYKLLAEKYRVSRPIENSRVYTNITNLPRVFRPYLRLNGKPLIGFDIANSQPLLAAIAFTKYSNNEYGFVKEDVAKYLESCEAGIFYEYFMDLNRIDTNCEETRVKFKAEFFGKIFYTKEVKKDNYLKTQFKEKYPTCYEAIFQIKGGEYYSKDYKIFPALMTEIETEIMFGTNMKIIKMGYDMVNIFDSLYSDNEEAIKEAKKMVMDDFAYLGIRPKLKDISYL
jgi:hypothetical protein